MKWQKKEKTKKKAKGKVKGPKKAKAEIKSKGKKINLFEFPEYKENLTDLLESKT